MDEDIIIAIIGVILFLALSLGIILFSASQEAKSYRKFCDTEVSTWDALWLELRIDMCKK